MQGGGGGGGVNDGRVHRVQFLLKKKLVVESRGGHDPPPPLDPLLLRAFIFVRETLRPTERGTKMSHRTNPNKVCPYIIDIARLLGCHRIILVELPGP